MKDLITYCKDTTALILEIETTMPDKLIRDENTGEAIGFDIAKTPTVRNGSETLSIVRVNNGELEALKSLKNIVVLSETLAGGDLIAAMSVDNRAVYDRVYDQTPQTEPSANGVPDTTVTPPELIGRFA